MVRQEDLAVPFEVRCEQCGAAVLAVSAEHGGEVASMLEREPGRVADWAILEARNQELFRSTNERLALGALGVRGDDEQLSFFCECGNGRCWSRASLTLVEYEAVRADPTRFLIAHDYVDPEVESPRTLQLVVSEARRAREIGDST